jgi:hypothetical protein
MEQAAIVNHINSQLDAAAKDDSKSIKSDGSVVYVHIQLQHC